MESVPIFPPPPGYSTHFAPVDVPEAQTPPLPLLPPPRQIEGEYVVFGELQQIETGIPKLTVEQLFDEKDVDYKEMLHVLHKDVLGTYEELIQTVIENPERYARLTERIGVLIRNMIQIVNHLRPYQVQKSRHVVLDETVLRNKALEEIRHSIDEARALLDNGLKATRTSEMILKTEAEQTQE